MKRIALATLLTLACCALLAQNIDVKDAWIRTAVPGQKATGAFMKITAKDGAKLVSGSTPAAGVTEVHEMKMDGDIMRMRAVPGGLDLPAGKTVELKSGGYHVMLMDLKQQMKEGDTVSLTLVVEGKDKKRSTIEVKAPVKPLAAAATTSKMDHDHKH